MADVKAEIKRGFLRSLYRLVQYGTQTNPVTGQPVATLADVLNAFQDGGFSAIKSGRLIIQTAGAGHSVSYQPPDVARSFTQDQVFSLSEELQQVYADAIVTLSGQSVPSPTDLQIFNVMIADDRLTTIKDVQRDFTTLRWPSRY